MTTIIKSILPATEARKKLFKVIDEVEKTTRHFLITKDGLPKAVIMSSDEWGSWLETLEIASDKKLIRSIRQAEEDFKRGRAVMLEQAFKRKK